MANNESKVLKTNTLEDWRQKTNAVSHHLGDVDQLDSRLTDKVYSYNNTSASVFGVYENDDAGKNLRFELRPEESIDAIATIIMTGSPTIPSSFVSNVLLYQGTSGSETFQGTINYININKISLRNTSGTFNPAVPIKFSTDSIAANKLVRLVSETYTPGYVKVTNNGTITTQSLVQAGFHVPNVSLRVVLSGSPSIPASFTEGATVTQSGGFSGTLYKATSSELLFKSFTGSFSLTQNAGIPHSDASNRIVASAISSQSTPNNTIGNFIELHTIPTSDLIKITSTNAIDAIVEVQDDIGEITSLGTTDKSDIVSSINELETAARGSNSDYSLSTGAQNFRDAIREHETDIGNMTFTGLSATDISSAIRELRIELGNHASLGTTYTTDAVGAINELETAVRGSAGNYTIGTNANDLVAAINEIETVLRDTNSDYALTTSAQNVRDAIREHEADIGNMTFTGLAASDISAAIRELRTELGDHSTIDDAAGYSATNASDGIVELQGDVGNVDNLTTSATKVVLAINELDLKQGAAALNVSATTLSGAINELESDLFNVEGGTKRTLASLGTDDKTSIVDSINELETAIRGTTANYTLGTSSGDLVGAINELHGEINSNDTDIADRLRLTGSGQTLLQNVTFGDSSNARSFTIHEDSTMDLSAGTLLLPGNASGVNTFSVSFLNIDGNQTSSGMGMRIDRAHIGGSPTPYPAVQWKESQVGAGQAERAWQLVGLNDAGTSSNTADIVTFYNAKDLIANNAESGIAVDWDSTNQNFDFNVNDPTLTYTGDVTGSGTLTNLGNLSIALTIAANAVENSMILNDSLTIGDSTIALGGTDTTLTGLTDIDLTVGNKTIFDTVGANTLTMGAASTTIAIPGNLSVNGNTTLGNASSDTVSIPGNLTITGDLTVNGQNTILSTTTLEVEDTLILMGNSNTAPTTGGFGLETRNFTGVGTHSNAASNVTGSHSIVYNFHPSKDRWEMDGSPLLSEATLSSPGLEVNGTDVGNLSGSKTLDIKAGTGIGLASTVNGDDFEVTITNTLSGYSGWFLSTDGTDRGNIADDERVDFFGDDAISVNYDTATSPNRNRVKIDHNDIGPGAGTTGQPSTEDGQYIKSITIDKHGHITALTGDDFDDRYVQEAETSTTSTVNKVVRRDASGDIFGRFANLTGSVPTSGTASSPPVVLGGNGSDNYIRGFAASSLNVAFADNADHPRISEFNNSANYQLLFVTENGTGQNQNIAIDTDNAHLRYNPSTNVLSGITDLYSTDFHGNLRLASAQSIRQPSASNWDGDPGTDGKIQYHSQRWYIVGGSNSNSRLVQFRKNNVDLSYIAPSGNFVGNVTGNADTSTQVYVNGASNSASYRLIFGETNDGHNGYETLYKDTAANIYYNPSSNTLTTTTFAGALSGNATTATTLQTARTIGGVSFNGSANINLPGVNTAGNQNTTGTATNATNAANVYTTQTAGTNATHYVTFVSTNSSANKGLKFDPGMMYNPSTNTLGDVNFKFKGTLTGNASTATSATSASSATTAGSITSQANSATTTHTSNNTANQIVSRDSSGNFSAGTISASLSGTATVASTVQMNTSGSALNYRMVFTNPDDSAGSKSLYKDSVANFYYNPSANRLYVTNLNANLASSTGYAYGNLTGTPTIPTNNNQLTNGAGYTTFAGNTYSNNMNQYVRTSDTVTFAEVRSSGDIIAYYSDDRLKDRINNIENALDKVSQLNGFMFRPNAKAIELGIDTDELKVGVSAQEVETILPEAVKDAPALVENSEDYKTVQYEKLVPLLIEAIKELKDQNKEMKAEIESLKSINS